MLKRWSRQFRGAHERKPPSSSYRPQLERLETRELLSAGALDPAFGQDGLVVDHFNQFGAETAHVELLAGGKFLVAGSSASGNVALGAGSSTLLARYNADGSIDPAFGQSGTITIGGGGRASSFPAAVEAQSNGKILVVTNDFARSFPIAFTFSRLNADGSTDSSFVAGLDLVGSTLSFSFTDLAVQADDKIFLLGRDAGTPTQFLARLLPDGGLDATFGSGGKVRLDQAGFGASTLAVQPDGKILVGGVVRNGSGMDLAVLRLDAAGNVDASFGQAGLVVMDLGSEQDLTRGVLVQPDGRIVVLAPTPRLRLLVDGRVDASFGTGGVAPESRLLDVFFQSTLTQSGQFVVAGTVAGKFALARFNGDGNPDQNFGTSGVVATVVPATFAVVEAQAVDVAALADGSLLAVGSLRGQLTNSSSPGAFVIAHYLETDPRSPSQRLVANLYRDLLHRAVDPVGLAAFSALLDRGSPVQQIVRAIQGSLEFRRTNVFEVYHRLLRRDAEPLGLTVWTNFLAQGGTTDRLEAFIHSSPEYVIRLGGGTAAGWLQALYRDMLGRDLDGVGQSAWLSAVTLGAPLTAIVVAIQRSQEGATRLVESLYAGLLGRRADPVGLGAFVPAIQQGISRDILQAVIASSPENVNGS